MVPLIFNEIKKKFYLLILPMFSHSVSTGNIEGAFQAVNRVFTIIQAVQLVAASFAVLLFLIRFSGLIRQIKTVHFKNISIYTGCFATKYKTKFMFFKLSVFESRLMRVLKRYK